VQRSQGAATTVVEIGGATPVAALTSFKSRQYILEILKEFRVEARW
jgi:hypothetical protein